jgi:hypothetical protein
MSSDNGYVVAKFTSLGFIKYGVFYWSGDGLDSYEYEGALIKESHYTIDGLTGERGYIVDSRHVYDDPQTAIVQAHKINAQNYTEYGVSVNTDVLEDCK